MHARLVQYYVHLDSDLPINIRLSNRRNHRRSNLVSFNRRIYRSPSATYRLSSRWTGWVIAVPGTYMREAVAR